MYVRHPSDELNRLFAHRPFQGAVPSEAQFLFVGLDANYDERLEVQPIFEKVREYHADGVAFWRRHGFHHPFLLPGYSGDGHRYHKAFSRIGFLPDHAGLVSFIELLHVPTIGRNKLTREDLDPSHLEFVDAAITRGCAEHVFLCDKVVRLMRATSMFRWLPRDAIEQDGPFGILFRAAGKTVYLGLHFSAYGRWQQRKRAQVAAMRNLVPASPPSPAQSISA
jgi:hypothetical protein